MPLFASKTKSYCIEFGEQTISVARLSRGNAPLTVEEIKEFPAGETGALKEYIRTAPGKGPTGYVHALCGISPSKRFVRRHTLDLKRLKDDAYFPEIYTQQFRIDPEKYNVMVINSNDGSEYDSSKGTAKEVIFCGMPGEEIDSTQDALLGMNIYPERLELTSVASLGALVSYLKFKQNKTPLLLLEFGADSTQSYILSSEGVEISRPIQSGISAMIPVVQKELGLKDEESAKKLFYSNTFDFTSMGLALTKKLLKELQSSIGFYEVQTGQSIGGVLCAQLPASLAWLSQTMASSLAVSAFSIDLAGWLESAQITFAPGVAPSTLSERNLGLFALIANYEHAATDQKK
jgi:hypothetical protein